MKTHSADEIQSLCDFLLVGFVNRDDKTEFRDEDTIIIEDETGTPVSVTFRELEESAKEPIIVGTKVRIVYPIGSEAENWFAVPLDYDTRDLPEGFQIAPGWGEVTGYDHESERSFGGKQSIVVVKHIHVGYDPRFWTK